MQEHRQEAEQVHTYIRYRKIHEIETRATRQASFSEMAPLNSKPLDNTRSEFGKIRSAAPVCVICRGRKTLRSCPTWFLHCLHKCSILSLASDVVASKNKQPALRLNEDNVLAVRPAKSQCLPSFSQHCPPLLQKLRGILKGS